MRLVLDENLPHDLRHFLPGHEVVTSAYMGWAGLRNGELLAAAAAAGFEVLVTLDSGVEHQQNLAFIPIGVVILEAPSSKLISLIPLVPKLLDALAGIAPRSIMRVK